MKTNLKVIVSAVGVAALLASPAMAKTDRHHHIAPATAYGPSDTRGTIVPDGATYGPYTPGMPSPIHGGNPDFQDGSRG